MIEFSLVLSHFNFKIIGDYFNYKSMLFSIISILSTYFHIFFKKILQCPSDGTLLSPLGPIRINHMQHMIVSC